MMTRMVRLIPCPPTFFPSSNSSQLSNSSSNSSLFPNSSNSLLLSNSNSSSSSSLNSSLHFSNSLLRGHPSELPSLLDQARFPNSNFPRPSFSNFSINSSRDKQFVR